MPTRPGVLVAVNEEWGSFCIYCSTPVADEHARGPPLTGAIPPVYENLVDATNQHLYPAVKEIGIRVSEDRDVLFEHALDEFGDMHRVAALCGDDIRRVDGKFWYVHDGTRWRAAADQYVQAKVRVCIEAFVGLSDDELPRHLSLELYKRYGKAARTRSRVDNVVRLLASVPGIAVAASELDANMGLLNTPAGTVELESGALRAHSRDDLITRITRAPFDLAAECSNWMKFLASIYPDKPHMVDFLARLVGAMLHGDQKLQALVFIHGPGANGKTTFVEGLRHMIGTYECQLPPQDLVARSRSPSERTLVTLPGCRLATSTEIEMAQDWNEALLKQITGGDLLEARRLYGERTSFRCQATLFVSSNHIPNIRGVDEGIWRRMIILHWPRVFRREEWDEELPKKLQAEAAGILAWAWRGLQDFLANGLGTPDDVDAARDDYRYEQDTIGRFMEDCCTSNIFDWVSTRDLTRAYNDWAKQCGELETDGVALGKKLGLRGIPGLVSNKKLGQRGWQGLGLK
jgi:putative DNA primase/helicase